NRTEGDRNGGQCPKTLHPQHDRQQGRVGRLRHYKASASQQHTHVDIRVGTQQPRRECPCNT
ncbi:hypothetical protein PLICRDRAFT_33301, partial [Plicaturopsis crispa FD-325 SS-3]